MQVPTLTSGTFTGAWVQTFKLHFGTAIKHFAHSVLDHFLKTSHVLLDNVIRDHVWSPSPPAYRLLSASQKTLRPRSFQAKGDLNNCYRKTREWQWEQSKKCTFGNYQ